jgi:glycosyltransferase involved in cell wall biosynthesis
MKVLMITPYLGATYGGTSKVVLALAHHLGQLGVQVDVVTSNANDIETLAVDTQDWIDQGTYRVRYFACWHRRDLIFSRDLGLWLIQHLKAYDLVHSHTLFAPMISLTHGLCRWYKVPYVMTPHGMLEPWALAYKAWKKKLYYQCFEKSALQLASAVHVLSSVEAEQVTALGMSSAVVVPNGINSKGISDVVSAEEFYQAFPETVGKTLILFLGRIDPKKGLDLLAAAFANAHAWFPNTHLVIAGPDSIDFTPTVRAYFAHHHCLDAVTFTGMLEGDLKSAALAAACVYVAPSYSEGFSISVLEGMAAGLPCIITHGCNFPEAAEAEAAYVVEAESEALAEALRQCLGNLGQAQAMGQRARELIGRFYTWEQSAKKLLDLYESITVLPTQGAVTVAPLTTSAAIKVTG